MTKDELFQAFKIGVVIVYGILGLLSAFGPLAQYREWFVLIAGVVSVIAGAVFGVNLKNDRAERIAGNTSPMPPISDSSAAAPKD